jgi:N-sulfoglucosamine sulfohydrolase
MARLNVIAVICHDWGRYQTCNGAEGVRSPNVDEFAEGGVRFQNYFCTAPQCSPSRAAIWTGRYPHANGVIGLVHSGFANDLHPHERHLAQVLGENGYDTHVFGNQHVTPQGPERLGYRTSHGAGTCEHIAENAAQFIRGYERKNSPLFMQVAFFEPHRPFPVNSMLRKAAKDVTLPPYLPDLPEVREDFSYFEASAASADAAFGRIVDAVDRSELKDDTIVIFTSDHGIPFPRAKMTLYDPGIETALVMRIPGYRGGVVHPELISNVDLFPTLLELLDIPVPETVQGRSFLPLLRGDAYSPRSEVFAEKTFHTYYDPMRAVRTKEWKLIVNFEHAPFQEVSPDYDNNALNYPQIMLAMRPASKYHPFMELYHLQSDPLEQTNLAEEPAHRTVRDELARKLRGWMEESDDPLLHGPIPQGAFRNRMGAFREIGG